MAIDGMVTRALAHESAQRLSGGRIAKIYQPNATDILLQIRMKGHNFRLLLSAHPAYPRVHLSKERQDNPLEPPMFCMLLRKHCEGAWIRSIGQIGLERMLYLDIDSRNELGDTVRRRLLIELMGRHSNIILLDPDSGHIFDGIRRVTPAISQYRQVVPGAIYKPPPDQGKRDPLTVDEQTFLARLDFNKGRLDRQLVAQYTGMGPLLAKEIVHRAGLGSRQAYWTAFQDIIQRVRAHEYEPTIVYGEGKDVFSVIPLTHVKGDTRSFDRMHDCVAAYYQGKAERDAARSRAHDLTRFVQNEWKKNEKKLRHLQRDLDKTERADQYRLFGELLTAFMYQVRPGDTEIEVVNYYEESGETVVIPLDPKRSPADNAQQYFKKYNKAKASRVHLEDQIRKTKENNTYLAAVLQQLESADLQDIEDIREELVQEGFLRRQKQTKKRKASARRKPELTAVESSEGIAIYVGRNNRQNEYLTNRLANDTDTWLHAKDMPGSHVVIRGTQFGEDTLLEAAQLAAYFSKGRASNQVPIDYTQVKHVRKPNGAKPGFVIYDQQKTLYVNPDETLIRNMQMVRK